MTAREVADRLNFRILAGHGEKTITGFYACDLLSWVISHAGSGNLWVTVMNNLNVLAVATLADVACIVIPEGIEVDGEVLARANAQNITVLSANQTGAEVIVAVSGLIKSV